MKTLKFSIIVILCLSLFVMSFWLFREYEAYRGLSKSFEVWRLAGLTETEISPECQQKGLSIKEGITFGEFLVFNFQLRSLNSVPLFMRMKINGEEYSNFIMDSSASDLLALHKGSAGKPNFLWLVREGENIFTFEEKRFGIAPVKHQLNDPEDAQKSPAAILVLKGLNMDETVLANQEKPGVVDFLNKSVLICPWDGVRSIVQSKKLTEPADIQKAKEGWDKEQLLHNIQNACAFLENEKNREKLLRFAGLSSSCPAAVKAEELSKIYDEAVVNCQAHLNQSIPAVERFFASDSGQ